MANILEYLEWRGDLPLSSVPFNEVDAAILARLSYLPLETVLENQGGTKQSGKEKEMTIARSMEALAAADTEQLRFLWHEDPKLIDALRASRRFAQLTLFAYSERFDIPSQTQFAAVSIRLAPALCYVSFRGTDDTLVGWQEDLNMGFVCPVPSQELAVEYLEALAKESTDEYITGGHSKGGNLAVYAAAFCAETVQNGCARFIISTDRALWSVFSARRDIFPCATVCKPLFRNPPWWGCCSDMRKSTPLCTASKRGFCSMICIPGRQSAQALFALKPSIKRVALSILL